MKGGRVICVGENEIGKIKSCIYYFSIKQFFFKFLEIYFLAQSILEKKLFYFRPRK